MDKYILKDREVVSATLDEWAEWFQTADRKIAFDEKGDVAVSTVFLGIDHSFEPGMEPVVFETMVFGGEHDQLTKRYSTYDQAEFGHKEVVAEVFDET